MISLCSFYIAWGINLQTQILKTTCLHHCCERQELRAYLQVKPSENASNVYYVLKIMCPCWST